MPVYHVSYDLNRPGQNYQAIEDELARSAGCFHAMQSTWFIFTSETATELNNRLVKVIDSNDTLFVSEAKNSAGWLSENARRWLDAHISL